MNDHAVVLGAGIAGLIAATVLAERFDSVTVVERDWLPNRPTDRRGTPQGHHLHSLLSRGSQIMEELLPGFLADLVEAGALVLDDADMHRMYSQVGPYTFNRTGLAADPAALVTYLASRPFLEFHLRGRVMAMPNVSFLDGHVVDELIAARPNYVTGVTVSARDSGRSETLNADLIVDATGRASRAPLLLRRLGHAQALEQTFTVGGIYHSQRMTIPDQDDFLERLILVLPEGKARRGGLVACEHDAWTLTIAGRARELVPAPTDFTDMLALARDFVPEHVQPALRRAQPLTKVLTHRYPGGMWRRYDQTPNSPRGFLVVGDALCNLDPINGQGMTMAALHGVALRSQLRSSSPVDPQAFYAAVAAFTESVWTANARQHAGADEAPAPVTQRAGDWARRKILESAAHDMVVTERLMRVANFIDPPRRLLEPAFLARIAAHQVKTRLTRGSRTTSSPSIGLDRGRS